MEEKAINVKDILALQGLSLSHLSFELAQNSQALSARGARRFKMESPLVYGS